MKIAFIIFVCIMVFHLVVNIAIKTVEKKDFQVNSSFLFFLNILTLVIAMVSGAFLAYFTIILGPQPAEEARAFQNAQLEYQQKNNESVIEIISDIQDIKQAIIISPDGESVIYDDEDSWKDKVLDMIFDIENTVQLTNGNTAYYKYTIIAHSALNSVPEENYYLKGKGSILYGYPIEKLDCKNYVTFFLYDVYEEK